tara:strand:- start:2435 stop:2614 length:180 start_codon:yes stop_codon:yes gene_type:complete
MYIFLYGVFLRSENIEFVGKRTSLGRNAAPNRGGLTMVIHSAVFVALSVPDPANGANIN